MLWLHLFSLKLQIFQRAMHVESEAPKKLIMLRLGSNKSLMFFTAEVRSIIEFAATRSESLISFDIDVNFFIFYEDRRKIFDAFCETKYNLSFILIYVRRLINWFAAKLFSFQNLNFKKYVCRYVRTYARVI